ncbi:hypothetical protein BDZ90DRAFT_258815 [Jaminaea rosea]|uniref:Uncharacterized protein n=1 Tax=Jaminaea rosea TaxID=1569628 RepID=A0A316UTW2_9BASI|nr:hypothetical protein BDZ90DRAFT_258815 [Jaminaea rosea]PWN28729.1 hypothetical protein BDZ90DRAFT_258815 [Jaminaea rosea]
MSHFNASRHKEIQADLSKPCPCGAVRTFSMLMQSHFEAEHLVAMARDMSAVSLLDTSVIRVGEPHTMTIKQFMTAKHVNNAASGRPERQPTMKMPRAEPETLAAGGAGIAQMPINPWLIGAWLGDGFHYAPTLCSADDETRLYLLRIVEELNASKPPQAWPVALKSVKKPPDSLGARTSGYTPSSQCRARRQILDDARTIAEGLGIHVGKVGTRANAHPTKPSKVDNLDYCTFSGPALLKIEDGQHGSEDNHSGSEDEANDPRLAIDIDSQDWRNDGDFNPECLQEIQRRLPASCPCGGTRTFTILMPSDEEAQHFLRATLSHDATYLLDANIIRPKEIHSLTVAQFFSAKHIENAAKGSPERHPALEMPRYPFETLPSGGAEADDMPFPPYRPHPHLLGAWLGDGCQKSITIFSSDNEMREWIYSLIITPSTAGGTISCPREDGEYFNPLLRAMQELDMLGNWKARSIPWIYLIASEGVRAQVLAGRLDTDGTPKPNNGRHYCFTQCDKHRQILDDVGSLRAWV